jgi:DNA-binding response OmpR family regulator
MTPTETRALRVLVVDDDEEFAATTARKLTRRGFAAEAVFSGADAVARMRDTDFDVAVIDLNMPGMDGIALLREAKGIDVDLAVIVVTGYASVNSGIEGMRTGASDYLLKPINMDHLVMAIEAAVEQENARGR